MGALSKKVRLEKRRIADRALRSVEDSLGILEEKKNPFVLPLLRAVVPSLITAAVNYISSRAGVRVPVGTADSVSDAISLTSPLFAYFALRYAQCRAKSIPSVLRITFAFSANSSNGLSAIYCTKS